MKTIAARRRDTDDVRPLVGLLDLTSSEQVIAMCSRVFPDEPLSDRAVAADYRVIAERLDALAGLHIGGRGACLAGETHAFQDVCDRAGKECAQPEQCSSRRDRR